MRLIRIKQVEEITGLAQQTIRNKIWRGDENFPASVVLPGSRIRVWRESDVREWVESLFDDIDIVHAQVACAGGRKTKARQVRERQEGLRLAGK